VWYVMTAAARLKRDCCNRFTRADQHTGGFKTAEEFRCGVLFFVLCVEFVCWAMPTARLVPTVSTQLTQGRGTLREVWCL
jgi:hypothetical protein